jgi:hypothetical protein
MMIKVLFQLRFRHRTARLPDRTRAATGVSRLDAIPSLLFIPRPNAPPPPRESANPWASRGRGPGRCRRGGSGLATRACTWFTPYSVLDHRPTRYGFTDYAHLHNSISSWKFTLPLLHRIQLHAFRYGPPRAALCDLPLTITMRWSDLRWVERSTEPQGALHTGYAQPTGRDTQGIRASPEPQSVVYLFH